MNRKNKKKSSLSKEHVQDDDMMDEEMDSDTFEHMCMYPNNKWDMFKGNKNFTQVLFRDCMDSEPIIVKTNSQGNILGISIKH